MITSVAFQDHITRSLLHPLHDPLLRLKKPPHTTANLRAKERGLQRQAQQQEREYVLDSSPSPLTLGKMSKIGKCAIPYLCNSELN